MSRNSILSKILIIVVLLISLIWLLPLVIVVLNSIKPYSEVAKNLFSLPTAKNITFEMYKETWTLFKMSMLFRNTILYTCISVFSILLFGSMSAYWLSRTKTKFSNFILFIVIIPIMIPFQTYMISLASIFSWIGLIGTKIGYIIVLTGIMLPLAVFIIHGFIKNIPIEVEESAYIDGASRIRTFFSIILPLSTPALTTVAVISALFAWNDIIVNIIMVGGKANMLNIQHALYTGFSTQASDWSHAMPGIVISIIPTIVFFIFMQRYIVKGIIAGAVKG